MYIPQRAHSLLSACLEFVMPGPQEFRGTGSGDLMVPFATVLPTTTRSTLRQLTIVGIFGVVALVGLNAAFHGYRTVSFVTAVGFTGTLPH